MVRCTSLLAEESAPPPTPVEEWQIRGILAALEDGYPEVRAKAVRKLAAFLGLDPSAPAAKREWKWTDAAHRLAADAVGPLRELLTDSETDIRGTVTTAINALIRLGAGDEATLQALRGRLKDPDHNLRFSAAEALGRLGAKDDATHALRELLKDPNQSICCWAADALGRLGTEDEATLQALREMLKGSSPEHYQRLGIAAAEALGRLGAKDEAIHALREWLKEPDHNPRFDTVEALVRLEARDEATLQALREMLKEPAGGRTATEALVRLGAKDEATLRAFRERLKDPEPEVRLTAAEALVRLGAKDEATQALRGLLKDSNHFYCFRAAVVLGLLGAKGEATQVLRRLLKVSPEHYRGDLMPGFDVRIAAAVALERLGAKAEATQALRELLKVSSERHPEPPGLIPDVRISAAGALGQLGAKDEATLHALHELLKQQDHNIRFSAARALARLGEAGNAMVLQAFFQRLKGSYPTDLMAVEDIEDSPSTSIFIALSLPYEDTNFLSHGRWLARYWGGVSPRDSEVLCRYLGRPKAYPELPRTREKALPVLDVLAKVWEERVQDQTGLRLLREDAASWMSLIITDQVKDWRSEDAGKLRGYLQQIEKDQDNARVRAYIAGIRGVIESIDIWPPPWVRTCLAVGVVNVVAIGLLVLRPGRSDLEKWLPFLGFAGTGTASWIADQATTKLHLEPWLLGGLLLGELVALLAVGAVSPAVLRQLATIEPLNRVAVPLALRLPWSRRRIFRDYVAALRNQLDRDRRQANDERYVALPADIATHADPNPTPSTEPVAAVLRFLTGAGGGCGHVLIEAPGGRGKSTLLREVVRRAVDRFEARPGGAPLPVLLTGSGESIEQMLQGTLASVLIAPEVLPRHLAAGDFLPVLDGISESGLPEAVLDGFVKGPHGGTTPLLVGSRPVPAVRDLFEGTARWMVAEPRRLDEQTLRTFVAHYGGPGLSEPLRRACRGTDETYLPILVRMAMTLGDEGDGRISVADIYRAYILRLFKELPEAERLRRLDEAARWCLATYWVDGLRRRSYEASDVQQRLLQAGVLVPADRLEPPKEVQFFHDSMQSYLTASGLAAEDRRGYAQLPRPGDSAEPWGRSRVLLRAAGDPTFAGVRSDILLAGGSELFQMCLATLTPRQDLRLWLRDELVAWAEEHAEDLRRRDLLAATPPSIRDQVQRLRGAARILAEAARACLAADEKSDAVEKLGTLYAGIAPLVYELSEGDGSPGAGTSASAQG